MFFVLSFSCETLDKRFWNPKTKQWKQNKLKKQQQQQKHNKKQNETNQQTNKYPNQIPVLALKFHNMECWKHFACIEILLFCYGFFPPEYDYLTKHGGWCQINEFFKYDQKIIFLSWISTTFYKYIWEIWHCVFFNH